ncbi:hypothetical protein Ahy_B03g063557 isoform B [Arachis hypogaea]|uniref:Uncharacterized protein n=1 Tax=Arachis hypogaea TaxID=3818 RepID=A0A444ZXH0_ARAHY|nr:hypothetical protein Ahy_B03g063557 isoform B [Arachis hypogaea]
MTFMATVKLTLIWALDDGRLGKLGTCREGPKGNRSQQAVTNPSTTCDGQDPCPKKDPETGGWEKLAK